MPCFDGPYTIIDTNPTHSTVTVNLPNMPHLFPVFHTSEIHPFNENDEDLLHERALHPPEPLTIDRHEEFFIEKIVDERQRGRKLQYRVCWTGEGPEGDKWLPASEVEDCEALDVWITRKNTHQEEQIDNTSHTQHRHNSPPQHKQDQTQGLQNTQH